MATRSKGPALWPWLPRRPFSASCSCSCCQRNQQAQLAKRPLPVRPHLLSSGFITARGQRQPRTHGGVARAPICLPRLSLARRELPACSRRGASARIVKTGTRHVRPHRPGAVQITAQAPDSPPARPIRRRPAGRLARRALMVRACGDWRAQHSGRPSVYTALPCKATAGSSHSCTARQAPPGRQHVSAHASPMCVRRRQHARRVRDATRGAARSRGTRVGAAVTSMQQRLAATTARLLMLLC